MDRISLILWNAGEAEERAKRLRDAGYRVDCYSDPKSGEFLRLKENPPAAVVIDLGRIPSQGRDLAIWVRRQRATRQLPLVVVRGEPDRVARMRQVLPDAVYTTWRRLPGDLRRAIQRPPESPVVPGALAGYSGTPLPRKLGIKAGRTVALLGAPDDFEETLGSLPADVRLRRRARGEASVVLLFTRSLADLKRRFAAGERTMAVGGRLWICWPKKISGVSTDLTQKEVRAFGLAAGLVDYKIASIDETWSGLCFARRRQAGD